MGEYEVATFRKGARLLDSEDKVSSSPSPAPVNAPREVVRDQDKIMLIFAYLGLFAAIPLLTVRDSEFVRWHAKMGLILGVGGWAAILLLGGVLAVVPVLGCLTPLIVGAAACALVFIDILAMARALSGARWRIPVVITVAERLQL